MGDGTRGPGFLQEAPAPLGVGGELTRQDLDRDRPLQPGVGRAIDLAHAALPQRLLDAVLLELGADHVDPRRVASLHRFIRKPQTVGADSVDIRPDIE